MLDRSGGIAMTIKLYTWPQSSGTKVAWALEELGLPYERVVLDRTKGENRASEYLAIHPSGRVPALVDGDVRLFESTAILAWLGDKYGAEKGLWPRHERERAEALSWTVWTVADLSAHMMQYAYHGLDSPVSYAPAQRSQAAADYSRSQFERSLDALEHRLGDREFVLGGFTLVDVAAASIVGFGQMLGVDLGDRKAVRPWLGRCSARPACTRAT
jgi:glutathione S-transferase